MGTGERSRSQTQPNIGLPRGSSSHSMLHSLKAFAVAAPYGRPKPTRVDQQVASPTPSRAPWTVRYPALRFAHRFPTKLDRLITRVHHSRRFAGPFAITSKQMDDSLMQSWNFPPKVTESVLKMFLFGLHSAMLRTIARTHKSAI
jgi:hypothetical protein